jgi:hypothetical protein
MATCRPKPSDNVSHNRRVGIQAARRGYLCQHQAEGGERGWQGEQMRTLDQRRETGTSQRC